METEIKRIIKKKHPTGQEVGKTLLFMLVRDTQNANNKNYKPTVTQAQFDEMVYSFSKEQDFIDYAFYKELYEVLLSARLFVDGLEQQILRGMIQIQHMIQRDNTAEREKWARELTPLVMTEKQYSAYKANPNALAELDYTAQQRIQRSGIAVLQGTENPNINSEGNYVEPNTYIAQEISLERMGQDVEYQKRVKLLYNNVVISSVMYLQSYNLLLEILAKVCQVEELQEIKRPMQSLKKQVQMINETIDSLESNLYGTPEEKKNKQKILHKIFPKMPQIDLQISKEKKQLMEKQIQAIKEEGKTIHNLQEFNGFIEELVKGG